MLIIPIMAPVTDESRQMFLEDLQRSKADQVLLCSCEIFSEGQARYDHFSEVKKDIAFYTEAGLRPAIWTNTLGWGSPRSEEFYQKFANAARITSFSGGSLTAVCPLDEDFAAYMERNMEDYAKTGARLILLDDELVLSVRPGYTCSCELHLAEFARRTGREWTREEIAALFAGEPNEYRNAWLDLAGESIMNFSRRLRAAVDRVDPTIRLGLCASYTHYDIDGLDMKELLRLLAGEGNRPYLRLSGAPYWPCIAPRFPGQRLASVAEFVRMQSAWLADTDFEILDEDDSYPRLTTQVPASICEIYDKVTLTQTRVDRLKYILHYGMNKEGDTEYLHTHLKNMPHDEKIKAFFADKSPIGYRIFCAEHKIRTASLPTPYMGDYPLQPLFSLTYAGTLAAMHGVPTRYTGEGPTVVFGEDARYLPDALTDRPILADRTAAAILREKGIAFTALDVDIYTIDFTEMPNLSAAFRAAAPALPMASDNIYLLASVNEAEDEMALMLINDEAADKAHITVSPLGAYEVADCVNGSAKIEGDALIVEKIAGLDFASVLLKKK